MDAIRKMLGKAQVAGFLGICKRGVERMVQRGQLPQGVLVGGRSRRWFEDHIVAYQERLRKERGQC